MYPSLYQINTRVFLTERSRALGRRATLDDVPDADLERVTALGFDWVWLLSVWRTGAAGQQVSRASHEWRREFKEGNGTWDCVLAWSWEAEGGRRMLVAVNFAEHASQCYLLLPFPGLAGRTLRLSDRLGSARYEREGSALESQGLYLDLPAWGHHAFEIGDVE